MEGEVILGVLDQEQGSFILKDGQIAARVDDDGTVRVPCKWTSTKESFPPNNKNVLGVIVEPFLGGAIHRVGLVQFVGRDGKGTWSEAGAALDDDGAVTYWKWVDIPAIPED